MPKFDPTIIGLVFASLGIVLILSLFFPRLILVALPLYLVASGLLALYIRGRRKED
jgi:hypothetical protein